MDGNGTKRVDPRRRLSRTLELDYFPTGAHKLLFILYYVCVEYKSGGHRNVMTEKACSECTPYHNNWKNMDNSSQQLLVEVR